MKRSFASEFFRSRNFMQQKILFAITPIFKLRTIKRDPFRQYIYDADERQCRKLQDIAHSLRSSYNSVHHMLTNNYDRITAPRGESVNHLHLY